MPQRVLFVCLGNICRSPTAHGVFADMVAAAGLASSIVVDSAGTGAWHVGEPPDQRAVQAARAGGYDISLLRARQVQQVDFQAFDFVLAMDDANLEALRQMAPAEYDGHLGLFLDFAAPGSGQREVPDPYSGGMDGFAQVLALVEDACRGLLAHVAALGHTQREG